MTGRAGRMVRTAKRGGGFCYAKRENDDEQLGRLNVAEKNAFMRGDKVGLCCNAVGVPLAVRARGQGGIVL
jgi:hypothetical protein